MPPGAAENVSSGVFIAEAGGEAVFGFSRLGAADGGPPDYVFQNSDIPDRQHENIGPAPADGADFIASFGVSPTLLRPDDLFG